MTGSAADAIKAALYEAKNASANGCQARQNYACSCASCTAWLAYHAKRRAEEARQAVARRVYEGGARALAARIGRLPGVKVIEVGADDFGRAGLAIEMSGSTLWTRPVRLDSARDYARLRDALAAVRRGDWTVAKRWLDNCHPGRCRVEWGGITQERYGRNEYHYERWR